MSKVIGFEEAAALIPDNAVVSVNGASGLGTPDAMLRAIGERFEKEGHPRRITTLHPIAAGDMYGIHGIDHIAREGLLKRVIAGSYPSGPSSMPSPRIWRMIHDNRVEAYNLPSGILFHMHREAAAGRPGVLSGVGLDTFVDPRRHGARMNDATLEDIVEVVRFDGREWLYYRSIPVDVALIRGTTADEDGNITCEHEGSSLGNLDLALAAHNHGGVVIAQVKRLAAAGTLSPQMVKIPSTLVDCIVLDPEQMQTTQTPYDPSISGQQRRPLSAVETVAWGPEKIIARRAAMQLATGDVVNLGFGISAQVPRILAEEGLGKEVTWAIEQGAVGGFPLLGFQFGCAANPDAILSASDQFTYFQGGGFDKCLLSFMQVDREGNVNVSRLSARPHVTAGAGGFLDITASAKNIVFSGYFTAGAKLSIADDRLVIEREGKVKKLTHEVEHVTFSGCMAKKRGQHVTYITERCVMRLLSAGLTITEIAPGIDLDKDVLAQSEFALKVSAGLKTMDSRIFRPDVMHLQLA